MDKDVGQLKDLHVLARAEMCTITLETNMAVSTKADLHTL